MLPNQADDESFPSVRGDKSEHVDLPSRLSSQIPESQAKNLVIAVPNYRLSHHPDHPERISTVHPMHELDIARSLLWLTDPKNVGSYLGTASDPSQETRIRSIYLAGHSCGATILSNLVFLLPNIPVEARMMIMIWPPPPPGPPSETSWTPEEKAGMLGIMRKVKGMAFLAGIFDLNDLIDEYPSYEFFVEKAFGTDSNIGGGWDQASVPKQSAESLPEEVWQLLKAADGPRMVVAHALEDELLSERQSLNWFEWLKSELGESERLVYDNESLIGSHDGSLQHEGLGVLLAKLVKQS